MEKPESEYNMVDWGKKVVFRNYANFTGRARRAEFWWFALINLILFVPVYFIAVIGGIDENPLLGGIAGIVFLT